jgi:hypothetical protein
MKTLVIAIVMCTPLPALAWDGPGMWYRAADDGNPGGGGILGTGGQHDYGIKCSDCHVQRPDEPNLRLDLAYSPALINNTFVPGQRYAVTATLSGTGVRCAAGPNGGGSTKVNNFAVSFEDDRGNAAGMLAADDGQSAPSCALPSPPPAGTTALDGDCKVVFGQGNDRTRWTFMWTAPASGTIHVYWGAVDGNCDMMSMGDAVTNGTTTLAPPPTLFLGLAIVLANMGWSAVAIM